MGAAPAGPATTAGLAREHVEAWIVELDTRAPATRNDRRLVTNGGLWVRNGDRHLWGSPRSPELLGRS